MCHLILQMFSHLYRFWFTRSKSNGQKVGGGEGESTNKITVMENRIAQLEEQNKELQKQIQQNLNKEAALQKVLCNYDNLLKKVIKENKNYSSEQHETSSHLTNLENAFYVLLQKYEKAKLVVHGFQQNEAVLKQQVEEYEEILEALRVQFSDYKSCSEKRVSGNSKLDNSFEDLKGKRRRLVTTI